MRFLSYLSFLLLTACTSELDPQTWYWQQPTQGNEFVEHRIFINVAGPQGDTARFYTDTGGGRMIYASAVKPLGLSIDSSANGDRYTETVNLAPYFKAKGYPVPLGQQYLFRGGKWENERVDGMLGANWFADKIWNFDYQNKVLYQVDSVDWQQVPTNKKFELGFMQDSLGNHLTHFPRIPIVVEGDTIQMLFDSGAMVRLSEMGKEHFDGLPIVAASFMVATIFDDWRSKHPDWPFLEKGDAQIKEDMIQVPTLNIGGYTVGPVWFARRADKNFTAFMSQWMDQPIEGAIGGSCLQYFRTVLVDYQKELVYFEREY